MHGRRAQMVVRGLTLALLPWTLLATFVLAQSADIGPPPGRLIDVGGRRLHLNCSGNGSPTVVIEAGASSFAVDFSLVQPEIAREMRVCSYDRAGFGWSDSRGAVDTPARIVADLHNLLAAAGEKPPLVMVGASAGGLYVRLYQLAHPQEVIGLVLIDPATEDRLFTRFEQQPVPIGSLTTAQLRSTLPAGEVPIPPRSPQTGSPFDRLPPDIYRVRVALDERLIASMPPSVSAEIVHESAEGQRAALAQLLESRQRSDNPLRHLPLVVLTRGRDTSGGLAETHASLAGLSTKGRHTVVADAGHEIHLFAPAVVVQAIQDVARAARQRAQLPTQR